MPEGETDLLRGLEERLARASVAAERLMGEAAAAAGRGHRAPPMGWQTPAGEEQRGEDVALLLDLVGRVRELVPADLQRRVAEALRELLLAVRAVIDWYLERLERRRREPPEVTDIPIS